MKIAFAAAVLLATTPAAAHERDDYAPGARGQSAFGYDEFYQDTGFGGRGGIFAYQGDGVYESPYDRDAPSPERLERDRNGRLTYDRDYPYRFRSRARVTSSVVVIADRMEEFDGGYEDRDDAATVRVHRDGRLSR